MRNVQIRKTFKNPERPGIYYRLLCLTGENKGTSYFLHGSRLVLGRSKGADIPVLDINSSKLHAEVTRIGKEYILTDLGSLNGIFINDERVIQKHLITGDRLIIGKTVYKYDVIDVKEDLPSLIGIKKEEEEKIEEKKEVTPEIKEKKPLNKKLLIGIGALAVLFLFDSEDPKPKGKRKPASAKADDSVEEDFRSMLKKTDAAADKEVKDKLAGAIHRGLRELREKNYFRAIQEFNMALILHPGHARASFYLSKTKGALDDEIGLNFLRARRETDALKYQGAVVSYCQVINLLEGYEYDERFIEAKEQIELLEEKLGLEKGATKCTERR